MITASPAAIPKTFEYRRFQSWPRYPKGKEFPESDSMFPPNHGLFLGDSLNEKPPVQDPCSNSHEPLEKPQTGTLSFSEAEQSAADSLGWHIPHFASTSPGMEQEGTVIDQNPPSSTLPDPEQLRRNPEFLICFFLLGPYPE